MNTKRAFSLILRVGALSGTLLALVSHDPSARASAPAQGAPVIPVPNLTAYWTLDESGGTTATDATGNGHDGTHLNTPTISAAGDVAPIPAGNARSLIFNAAAGQQHVSVSDAPALRISGPITVAAWVKPTADTPSFQKGVIEKWTWGSDINGYLLRLSWSGNGNNVPVFAIGNGTTQVSAAGPPQLVNGVWAHVAGVYDGTNLMIYVNGGSPLDTVPNGGPGAIVPTAANTDPLHVGKDYGANAFTGNIDEARVYNRALTTAEVQILHDGQPAPTGLAASGIAGGNRLTWTAPAGAPASITYSVLSGPSAGNYTTVVNGITATTYDDLAATPGVPTFYAVVAVTVMTSTPSSEVSSTPGPAGPPPPPPAPRTSKVGGEENPCGCGSIPPWSGWGAGLGFLLFLAAAALARKG